MVTINRRNRRASEGVETIRKPTMIDQYNKYMGGVDKADQLITYYGFYHCSKKWWKRLFFHLLDVSLVNAYLAYCSVTPGPRRLSHMDFRLAVATGLVEKCREVQVERPLPLPDASHVPTRLVGRDHFPEPGKKTRLQGMFKQK